MGHHTDEQDNKKTTPTSNIAPGTPLWYASAQGIHHQKDFGPGYDSHDPVGLHKGSFIKGNSVDRFGEIGFRYDKLPTGHGEVFEIVIDRKGGVKSDQAVVISIDRDPLRDGVDYNTGSVGVYNSLTVDGFDVNNIDLDLKTLNTDPNIFSYDDDNHRLTVNCPDGVDQIKVLALVPYKTTVSKLQPIVLTAPVTYRVDEYAHYGILRNGIPTKLIDSIFSDVIVDEPDNMVIYNHQTNYTVMTLPLPSYFVEQGDPALLDGYQSEIERWHTVANPLTANELFYTVGKTRSIEGTCYVRSSSLYPAQTGTGTWSALSAEYTSGELEDVAVHHVYDNFNGMYTDFIGADVSAIESLATDSTIGLTAHDFSTQSSGIIGSVWTSKSIKVGTDPDTDVNIIHKPKASDSPEWIDFPEMDPGGDSELLFFTLPTHEIYKYGNDVTEVGHMAQAMFKHRGVDPATVPTLKYCVSPDIKASDYIQTFPNNTGEILSAALPGTVHPLSASGEGKEIPSGVLLEAGAMKMTNWVTRNTTTSACSAAINSPDYDKELVLYDMSQLSNHPADYLVNEQELGGYYLTCNNHVDRQIYIKLESDVAEPAHGWGKTQMLLTIDRSSKYSTEKHAVYDTSINVKNSILHDENAGVTYKPGDNWVTGPTGPSLLEAAFGLPISLTVTPTFTGYDVVGSLSADEVTFLGLAPGFGSASALQAANDAANVTLGTLAISAFEHNNKTDLDDGTLTPYYINTQVVGKNFSIDELTTGNPKYIYMSNPGDTPITVVMDIPINSTGAASPLGDSTGSDGSPYYHGAGDVITNQTVESLGGAGTGPWRFTLQPNEGTDVIWQINNIAADTTHIIQTQTPGTAIQTATLTYK